MERQRETQLMASQELLFKTSRCSEFGHQEITIQFAEEPPVPNLQNMLISYFEDSVAGGASFLPGQTVQMGWALLRMLERSDGTLGVEEPSFDTESGWIESVDRSLLTTWCQKEVAASLDLLDRLSFPLQIEKCVVCSQVAESESVLLSRSQPEEIDSGWFFGCTEESHDHNEVENLSFVQLMSVTHRIPFIAQFLALPVDAEVLVTGPGRIKAHVWVDGEAIEPKPGSYLHALNSEAS